MKERPKRESMVGETVEYLKEKREQERIMKEGELEVKKKEIDLKGNKEKRRK